MLSCLLGSLHFAFKELVNSGGVMKESSRILQSICIPFAKGAKSGNEAWDIASDVSQGENKRQKRHKQESLGCFSKSVLFIAEALRKKYFRALHDFILV